MTKQNKQMLLLSHVILGAVAYIANERKPAKYDEEQGQKREHEQELELQIRLADMSKRLERITPIIDIMSDATGLQRMFEVRHSKSKGYCGKVRTACNNLDGDGFISFEHSSAIIKSTISRSYANVVLNTLPGDRRMYGFIGYTLLERDGKKH